MPKKQSKKKEETFKASLPIYSLAGKEVETVELDGEVFTGKVNMDVIHRAVVAYNANQRHGTTETKTISEVSGGGKKPYAQKGTGRARAGTIRSPLWRHGGIIFGPHPREYRQALPKKVRILALTSALNAKLNEKLFVGIEPIVLDEPKTKKFKKILNALKLDGKTLFIVDAIEPNVERASRNCAEVAFRNVSDFTTVDLLLHRKVIIVKSAIAKMIERIKKQ